MPTSWYVQMDCFGTWVTIHGGFKDRNEAEWWVERWKVAYGHYCNNFRYRQQADTPCKGEDSLRELGL